MRNQIIPKPIFENHYYTALNINEDLANYLFRKQTHLSNPIVTDKPNYNIAKINNFTTTCNNKCDEFLLGILKVNSNLHIANLRFSEIDLISKFAFFDILIGEKDRRTNGIAGPVIFSSKLLLLHIRGIELIKLGVYSKNLTASYLNPKINYKKLKLISDSFTLELNKYNLKKL